MKLHYWTGVPNFGDRLNPWLWPRVLEDFFNDDPQSLFFGIGTILNANAPRVRSSVVLGTGAGYGSGPLQHDESWTFYGVRGPLSAGALGLPPSMATTDPGMLVRRYFSSCTAAPVRSFRASLMPHWRSATAGLEQVCGALGIQYIDPGLEVDDVLARLGSTDVLFAEAMHGAIAADSLRIPWVSLADSANSDCLPFKWDDWCSSLGLAHEAQAVTLSTREEAEASLRRLLASARPRLSTQAALDQALGRLDHAIDNLRQDIARGRFQAA